MINLGASCLHCGHAFIDGESVLLRTYEIETPNAGVRMIITAPYCNEACAAHNMDMLTELAISLLAVETLGGACCD